MGIGDWGLGIGPNPQSPIPNPQKSNCIVFVSIKILIKLLFCQSILLTINIYHIYYIH